MATSNKAGDKPVKPAAKSATPAAKPKAQKAVAPAGVPAKKTATTRAAAPAKKVATPAAGQPDAIPVLTPDQRRYYVEVAAYFIAERRGFHGGSEMDDWVQAESEIDRLIREGILKP